MQDAVTAHSTASDANSKRKVALLYVLDSALKSGKARELKLKDKDPGMVKSMQRFCNAVAAGLPALLRATQNDPACYDKMLRVCQRCTSELSQVACLSAICLVVMVNSRPFSLAHMNSDSCYIAAVVHRCH